MVEELISNNANGSGSPKVMNLDLGSLGDAVNQSVYSGEQEEKVILEKPVEAQVIAYEIKLDSQLKYNQQNPNVKFYKANLYVTVEFDDPKTKEKVVSRDLYGGLRFYPKLDENGMPLIGEDGQPVFQRFWSNNANAPMASYFSKLLQRAQTFNKSIINYGAFFNFLGTNPKCMIKTEYTSFGGSPDKTPKEVIQEFVE